MYWPGQQDKNTVNRKVLVNLKIVTELVEDRLYFQHSHPIIAIYNVTLRKY